MTRQKQTSRRLVGYVRVSRVNGREGASFISPQDQRERIEALAASQGHTVIDFEQDLDEPGSKWERPGFQRALERVEAGEADGIAVARLDRFARSVADAARAVERLEAAGGTLVAVDLGMDTSTPAGRLMRNVLSSLAQFELERTRENWLSAGSHAVARGVHVCRVAPAGYRKGEGRQLEPDPEAAPIIREVFRRRGAGASWDALCKFLDERLPREDGRKWAHSTVQSMIRNRAYLGEAKGGGIVNPRAHPALVSRAEFEAANVVQVDGRHARGGDGGALLAGLLRCAGCGHPLSRSKKGKSGYADYQCAKRHGDGLCPAPASISVPRADSFIEGEVLAALASEPLAAKGEPAGDDLDGAVAALEAAEAELIQYRDANLVSVIGAEAFRDGLAQRQARIDQARAAVAEASASAPLAGVRDLAQLWPDLEVGERRALLRAVIDRAIVRAAPGAGRGTPAADRVEIVWR